MKIKTIVVMAAAAVLLAGARVKADDMDTSQTPLFKNNEFDIDMFGSYVNPERHLNKIFDTNIHHGLWGGGAGVTYFPVCFAGIGADTSLQFDARKQPNYVDGNVYLRWPIAPAHLAPYFFGGGGRLFNPSAAWFGDGGVGLEVRFTHMFGMFSDARYMWGRKTTIFGGRDQAVFRAGFKLAF